MRVALRDGTRIFFEAIGRKLDPEGPVMRERPTMLLLHGGPRVDQPGLAHTLAPLADVAQLVFGPTLVFGGELDPIKGTASSATSRRRRSR